MAQTAREEFCHNFMPCESCLLSFSLLTVIAKQIMAILDSSAGSLPCEDNTFLEETPPPGATPAKYFLWGIPPPCRIVCHYKAG